MFQRHQINICERLLLSVKESWIFAIHLGQPHRNFCSTWEAPYRDGSGRVSWFRLRHARREARPPPLLGCVTVCAEAHVWKLIWQPLRRCSACLWKGWSCLDQGKWHWKMAGPRLRVVLLCEVSDWWEPLQNEGGNLSKSNSVVAF